MTTPDVTSGASLLGRYELVHELGSGGMASVHLARVVGPADFTKWLAVKRIHPHLAKEQEFVDMFLDEARIAASLQHPHVASVFELGQAAGEYFIAMEYLHGEHLGRLARRARREAGRLPPELGARIVADAADGLHHAHEARDAEGAPMGLVHRDVSPQNIFITYDGQVKLTDFGIAKAAGRLTQTSTGHLKGKVAYMSPEQALGQEMDRRSDIFALGVVLWELVVGKRLFKAESEMQTLMRITSGNVTRPSSEREDVPEALEEVILRALSAAPEDRYATAADMARDLDRYIAATGRTAGPPEISASMGSLFSMEVERKDILLRECAERDFTPAVIRTKKTSRPPAQVSPFRNVAWAIGLAVVAGTAIGVWQGRESTPTLASSRIVTSPAGAEVWLDGEESQGRTPMTVEGLAVGRHDLRLELDGYEAVETTFDADGSDASPLHYTLRARAPEPVAVPQAPIVEPVVAPPAEVLAEPRRRRPRPRRTEMAAEATTVNPTPASLTVIALPWASASVDGQRARQTPLRGVRLSPGAHTIRYQVQGEGPARTERIRLEAGETRTVRLNTQ